MSEWTAPGSDGDEAEHVLPPPPPDAPGQWSTLEPGSHGSRRPPTRCTRPSPSTPATRTPRTSTSSGVQTPEQALAARGSNVRLVGILSLFTCPLVAILAIVWSFRASWRCGSCRIPGTEEQRDRSHLRRVRHRRLGPGLDRVLAIQAAQV